MRAVWITRPGGPGALEIRETADPEPGPGQVRIRVRACGVCHSDSLAVEGQWPGLKYPLVPGHEIAGVIDEIGSGVTTWKKGQRVGDFAFQNACAAPRCFSR